MPEQPPTDKQPPHQAAYSNKTHVSKTDPDAAIISHGQKLPLQLTYKEHFAVAAAARVVAMLVAGGRFCLVRQQPRFLSYI